MNLSQKLKPHIRKLKSKNKKRICFRPYCLYSTILSCDIRLLLLFQKNNDFSDKECLCERVGNVSKIVSVSVRRSAFMSVRRRRDGIRWSHRICSVEMGNTGIVEIAFVSSQKKFIHVVKSFELAFRDFALSSHLFIPSQKSILSLNPLSHQEYRK